MPTSSAAPATPYLLYAEDDSVDATLFERALRKEDDCIGMHRFGSGDELLNYLDRIVRHDKPLPRLVILDIKMPGVTGLEALETIREHPKLRGLPVIMMSSSSEDSDISRAYDHRANAYLVKPSRYRDLKDIVKTIKRFWLDYNQLPT